MRHSFTIFLTVGCLGMALAGCHTLSAHTPVPHDLTSVNDQRVVLADLTRADYLTTLRLLPCDP